MYIYVWIGLIINNIRINTNYFYFFKESNYLLNYFKNTFVLNKIALNHLSFTSSEQLKVQIHDENKQEIIFDLNKENTIQLVEWLVLKVLNPEF